MIKVAILTVSDSRSPSPSEGRGEQRKREDVSGQTIKNMLAQPLRGQPLRGAGRGAGLDADKFEICEYKVVADEQENIKKELIGFADEVKVDIVFTTGGTGLGPRDVTPEATAAVCEKMVPGLAEVMRLEGLKKTKNAMLSRGVAGIRGNTLIINLPGSPKAVKESLEIILEVLPHARDMLLGRGHK